MWVWVCTWRNGGGDFDLSALAADVGVGESLPAIVVTGLEECTVGLAVCMPAELMLELMLELGDLRALSWSSASFWLA